MSIPLKAIQVIPDNALSQIADHAPQVLPLFTPPPGAFISTAADETFTATAGPDIFVFDLNGFGNDTILGFDATQDLLYFTNAGNAEFGFGVTSGNPAVSFYSGTNLSGTITLPDTHTGTVQLQAFDQYGIAEGGGAFNATFL
jgi:hypothetical protein